MPKTVVERFETRTTKQKNGCWLWDKSSGVSLGYGKFFLNGKVEYAHRVSYLLHVGEIPEGLCVMHECDTPLCVNPSHLRLGTNSDNIRDMWSKGRGNPGVSLGDDNGSRKHPERRPRGTNHGNSKLSDSDVKKIRELYEFGCPSGKTQYSGMKLARMFGVHKKTIYKIVKGVAWTHVS